MKEFITIGVLAALAGCTPSNAATDGVVLLDHAGALRACEKAADDAPDGGHVAAQKACLAEAGVQP